MLQHSPEPDPELLPVVLVGTGFLIAIATMLIGDAYQIPALKHYGGITMFLLVGFGALIWARVAQKTGVAGCEVDIRKENSPILFGFDVGIRYACGIWFIVCAVISFLYPNDFSLGY